MHCYKHYYQTTDSNDNTHKLNHIIINFTPEGRPDSLALNISVRNKRKDKESGYKKLKYICKQSYNKKRQNGCVKSKYRNIVLSGGGGRVGLGQECRPHKRI
jgi:hypothetical protein